MNFMVDAQLPGTLARWLRGRGCDAVHVLEVEMGQTADSAIWEFCVKEGRILISKDEDFFIFATRPGDAGHLLWLRVGNCRTKHLLTMLNQRWAEIETAFSEGQRIVEVR